MGSGTVEAIYLGQSPHDVGLVIVLRGDDRPIGLCGLHDMDVKNRSVQFGILIGVKELWGKGHGSEATRLLVRSTRKLTLTDAGTAYVKACKRILEQVGDAERAAKEYSDRLKQSLPAKSQQCAKKINN